MKIFAFIGKTLSHVENLTDSTMGTVTSASNTVGVYAETQHRVAQQERDITLAESAAEGKIRLLELRKEIDEAIKGKPADLDTSKSIDDVLSGLGV